MPQEQKGRQGSDDAEQTGRSEERAISHSVNHEIRLDALSIFHERVASPKEIQKALNVPLATASHHVKELFEADMIELVKTEPRRGAVEHYYRAKQAPEVDAEAWRKLPKAARRGIASVAMQAVVADGLASLRHRRLETDENMYIAWMRLDLSAEGEAEVTALQAEILERYKEIKERDKVRVAEQGCDVGAPRIAASLWFERAQAGRPPRRDGDVDS